MTVKAEVGKNKKRVMAKSVIGKKDIKKIIQI